MDYMLIVKQEIWYWLASKPEMGHRLIVNPVMGHWLIVNKDKKDCLWKQRTHYRLENGNLGFIETPNK